MTFPVIGFDMTFQDADKLLYTSRYLYKFQASDITTEPVIRLVPKAAVYVLGPFAEIRKDT